MEWYSLYTPPSPETSEIEIIKVERKRNIFDEQVEAFMEMMTNPSEYMSDIDETKRNIGGRFKQLLELIDPVGINEKWWEYVNSLSKDIRKLRSLTDIEVMSPVLNAQKE